MTCTVIVRAMDAADLGVAGDLMAQLGYDIALEDLRARFTAVTARTDHLILIAERGGLALGLLHVFIRPALEKPVEAVVQSLVVDAKARSSGVGRLLMERAEGWARARGLDSLSLYTNVIRAEARAFYAALGYTEVAQSALLRKTLDRS